MLRRIVQALALCIGLLAALPAAAERFSLLVPDVIVPSELESERVKLTYLLREELSSNDVFATVNRSNSQHILQPFSKDRRSLPARRTGRIDMLADLLFSNSIDFGIFSEVSGTKGSYSIDMVLLFYDGPLFTLTRPLVLSDSDIESTIHSMTAEIVSSLNYESAQDEMTYDYDEMVFIPGGEATIGSFSGEPEEAPERSIYIPGFYIDRFEVTNAQYKRFYDATMPRMPENVVNPNYTIWHDGLYPTEKANHPVVNVTWHEADAYCKWAGKRLPSATEWEKAARGPYGNIYPWGNEYFDGYANLFQKGISYEKQQTVPGGTYTKSKSYYGVFDMAGNAWEWTADTFVPAGGLTGREIRKICKGGGWGHNGNKYTARASYKLLFTPDYTSNCLGFRCAK